MWKVWAVHVKVMKKFNEKENHFPDEDIRFNPTDLHAPNYHIMGVDLRNVDEVANKLKQAEVDFTVPTIFIAECVLVYMEAQNCTNLLKWFSSQFQSAVSVIYEQVNVLIDVDGNSIQLSILIVVYTQVNMNDRFGDVMLSNLRSRGCSLAGVEACITLDTQVLR